MKAILRNGLCAAAVIAAAISVWKVWRCHLAPRPRTPNRPSQNSPFR